eukprot:TRINITY_DN391_c0_g1_i2.p2 TRINITY_DN391_c0_g1~~TRINITY_DN391_c0_g1_i2.p2  ORF type:complete len:258 (-),score=59.59 TRINITY_DN391_c0_g1_i2:867-1640(-)
MEQELALGEPEVQDYNPQECLEDKGKKERRQVDPADKARHAKWIQLWKKLKVESKNYPTLTRVIKGRSIGLIDISNAILKVCQDHNIRTWREFRANEQHFEETARQMGFSPADKVDQKLVALTSKKNIHWDKFINGQLQQRGLQAKGEVDLGDADMAGTSGTGMELAIVSRKKTRKEGKGVDPNQPRKLIVIKDACAQELLKVAAFPSKSGATLHEELGKKGLWGTVEDLEGVAITSQDMHIPPGDYLFTPAAGVQQ